MRQEILKIMKNTHSWPVDDIFMCLRNKSGGKPAVFKQLQKMRKDGLVKQSSYDGWWSLTSKAKKMGQNDEPENRYPVVSTSVEE